jgi:hypothetical protein
MSFVKFQKSARGRNIVRIVLWAIVAIFVLGALWSFGSPGRLGSGAQKDKTVFSVNGVAVKATTFWGAFDNYRNYMGGDVDAYFSTMYYAVNQIVQQNVIDGECNRRGINATAGELAAEKQKFIDDSIKQAGEGTERARFLVEKDTTWDEYQAEIARDARNRQTQFKAQLRQQKLSDELTADVTVSDEELLAKYRTYEVRHILLKVPTERDQEQWLKSHPEAPPESAGGESASGPNAKPKWFARTDDSALQEVNDLRKRIVEGGEDFATLANEFSDDTGSAIEGGSLGSLTYDSLQGMVPEFRDALVKLNTGEVSEPVKSQFGYHIIKVDKRTDGEVPKDFESTKESLRDAELKAKKRKVFDEKIKELVEQASLDFKDKEPQVAWLLGNRSDVRSPSEETAAEDQALTLLDEIIAEKTKAYAAQAKAQGGGTVEGLAAYQYQIGTIYAKRQQWGDALAAYQTAMESNPVWQTKLAAGRCLVELNRGSEAVDLLKAVSEDTPGPRNARVHQELFTLFSRIGEDKLAQAELQIMQEAQQAAQMGGGMGGLGGLPLNVQ